MATTTKPRLRRVDDIVEGRETFRAYEVTVDGEVLGTVRQGRASTTHGYSHSMLGYTTSRRCWEWTTPDNCGDFEIATRREAVEGLVEFATPRGR